MTWRPYEPCRENEQQARRHRLYRAGESLFFTRQLEYMRPGLYEYPTFESARLVPMIISIESVGYEVAKPITDRDPGDEHVLTQKEKWVKYVEEHGGVCPNCHNFRTGREHARVCLRVR